LLGGELEGVASETEEEEGGGKGERGRERGRERRTTNRAATLGLLSSLPSCCSFRCTLAATRHALHPSVNRLEPSSTRDASRVGRHQTPGERRLELSLKLCTELCPSGLHAFASELKLAARPQLEKPAQRERRSLAPRPLCAHPPLSRETLPPPACRIAALLVLPRVHKVDREQQRPRKRRTSLSRCCEKERGEPARKRPLPADYKCSTGNRNARLGAGRISEQPYSHYICALLWSGLGERASQFLLKCTPASLSLPRAICACSPWSSQQKSR